MATRSVTRDIPALQLCARIMPETLDVEARTVELTWTTGARVLRGFFEPFWEELSLDAKHVRMDRLNSGAAPLLNAHNGFDLEAVIGVVESARLEKKSGKAKVRFARAEDDPEADKIFRKVKDKIIQNVSVGYRVHRMEKVEDDEEKRPVYRVVDWTPHEISMVPIGADAGAVTRAGATTNACDFIEERTMDPENDETPKPTKESPAAAATRAATQARVDAAKALSEAREAAAADAKTLERERVHGIRRIAKQSGLGEQWADDLIECDATVDQAREQAFIAMTRKDTPEGGRPDFGPRINSGDDARDKWIKGASSWLIERTGKRSLLEKAKQKSPELFEGLDFGGGNDFRGLSPMELARESLERAGFKTRGMAKMQMLGHAFTYRGNSYQTTSDFATLLENVLHKMLLGAYATQETTWQRFCGTDDVPDFRPSNRYRTGSLPSLPVVAEHGEYKNGAIPDGAKYTISTERHGEIFSLSREAIINDDMGALANLASEFGRAAARTIENDVYALLALNSGLGPTMSDSQPFFHANRANVGTGAAIAVASLDADRVLMRAQKDPSNRDFLSLSPKVLLVPDSLEGTARVINDAQYDPDTANKLQRPNMVRGLFSDIVGSPRLAAASTRRYMFADPSIAVAISVAFLEGFGRGPIMESQQGWRIDGVEWRVTQYAKAQVADAKAAVTNAGTP